MTMNGSNIGRRHRLTDQVRQQLDRIDAEEDERLRRQTLVRLSRLRRWTRKEEDSLRRLQYRQEQLPL
jgi:hypothetical protein